MRRETLEEQIVRQVREWIPKAAEHARNTLEPSSIRITITNPQCDDDDHTLYLEAHIREDHHHHVEGAIPGVDFKEEETESDE